MSTLYHSCLDVSNALRRFTDQQLGTLFQEVGTGRKLSASEARAYLVCEKAAGHEVVPLGPCDRFDYQKGCLGHPRQ